MYVCMYVYAFQVALMVKNPPVNAGDLRDAGSIPGSGRSPGEGNSKPLQYFCLGNPMDRGAWQVTIHGVTKSQKLSLFLLYTIGFLHIFSISTQSFQGGLPLQF